MICKFCGTKISVVAAPFEGDPNKWAIYRANGEEVIFYIGDNIILNQSKHLKRIEVDYIYKHIIGK